MTRAGVCHQRRRHQERICPSWYVQTSLRGSQAYFLPGGKIFVFTGILPVCKNDDGLASVLGHGTS